MTNFSATDSPMFTVAQEQGEYLSRSDDLCVGQDAQDLQREVAILLAGRDIETAMARYEATGCFNDRAAADAARLRMEELIRGRSSAQVARMERRIA